MINEVLLPGRSDLRTTDPATKPMRISQDCPAKVHIGLQDIRVPLWRLPDDVENAISYETNS